MRTTVLPATYQHAEMLAENLRADDAAEVMAAAGATPLEATIGSLMVSTVAWTCLKDGRPIAMFGAAPLVYGVTSCGSAWLLGSDEIDTVKREAWVHSRAYVPRLHDYFQTLTAYVDVRNKTSIQWMTRLGYRAMSFHPEFGIEKRPFVLFARSNNSV